MEDLSRRNLLTGILAIGSSIAIPASVKTYTTKDLETAEEGKLLEKHTFQALLNPDPYRQCLLKVEKFPKVTLFTDYSVRVNLMDGTERFATEKVTPFFWNELLTFVPFADDQVDYSSFRFYPTRLCITRDSFLGWGPRIAPEDYLPVTVTISSI